MLVFEWIVVWLVSVLLVLWCSWLLFLILLLVCSGRLVMLVVLRISVSGRVCS